MPKQEDVAVVAEESEVNRLMALDTTPWYQKPNLRFLYFCLVPAALGVEMTTGYDGSVLNGLQAVATWQERESHGSHCHHYTLTIALNQTLDIPRALFWVLPALPTTWAASSSCPSSPGSLTRSVGSTASLSAPSFSSSARSCRLALSTVRCHGLRVKDTCADPVF